MTFQEKARWAEQAERYEDMAKVQLLLLHVCAVHVCTNSLGIFALFPNVLSSSKAVSV